MRIQLLFFAVLRERLRLERSELNLPAGSTVGAAYAALAQAHPAIAGLLPRIQPAVNQEFVRAEHVLHDGDELALIPPVAGGAGGRRIAVLDVPLDLREVVQVVEDPGQGGVVTFTGNVRRNGQRPNVARLEYEAYVPMAEKVLAAVADEIEKELPGTRVAIHHRTGVLKVGDTAVVIAASAPHRAEAFDACRLAIDRLKVRAPIWKKEVTDSGEEWVGLGP